VQGKALQKLVKPFSILPEAGTVGEALTKVKTYHEDTAKTK
jgi:hypothetical protein